MPVWQPVSAAVSSNKQLQQMTTTTNERVIWSLFRLTTSQVVVVVVFIDWTRLISMLSTISMRWRKLLIRSDWNNALKPDKRNDSFICRSSSPGCKVKTRMPSGWSSDGQEAFWVWPIRAVVVKSRLDHLNRPLVDQKFDQELFRLWPIRAAVVSSGRSVVVKSWHDHLNWPLADHEIGPEYFLTMMS